jgi:hypothetical protein
MILLRDVKGAIRLDRSNDMPVHVLTCTTCEFNAINSSCLEVGALIKRVYIRLFAKISTYVLQQRINIKFCVILGNNASDTSALLSEPYGREALKNSSVSEWH